MTAEKTAERMVTLSQTRALRVSIAQYRFELEQALYPGCSWFMRLIGTYLMFRLWLSELKLRLAIKMMERK